MKLHDQFRFNSVYCKVLTINPNAPIKVNPKETPVINGIGKNAFFDKRSRIFLKIAAGRVMSMIIEIPKCQSRADDAKACCIAVKGSSNSSDVW